MSCPCGVHIAPALCAQTQPASQQPDLERAVNAVLVDDDPASSNNVSGLFGLQIEGTPCKISFRNLWLSRIDEQSLAGS